jgi:hypothetical protein
MWDILYIRRIFSECSVSPDNSFIDRRESSWKRWIHTFPMKMVALSIFNSPFK